ncbi:MAG: type IX secretion system sortase PorU [Bacteroidales bacterium]|nr:type IX secretion system sortase PorU [Bacteroidales bacterium]
MIIKNIKLVILLIIPFVIVNNSVFSQTFSEKINWKKNKQIIDSTNSYTLLDFDNILYDKNMLPYYGNKINIDKYYNGNYSYSLKPENIKFIALSNEELTGVKYLEKLSNDFEFKSKMFFARGVPYIKYNFSAVRKNKTTGLYEKIVGFDLKVVKQTLKYNKAKKIYADNSILSSGTWKRIKIQESGIYKLTYDELQNIGITNPENVRIFGNATGWLPMIAGDERPDDLVENDILKENNSVIFYAQGPDRWDYNESENIFEPVNHYYSDYSYYFLTSDVNTGYNNTIKIENQSSLPETHNVNSYSSYAVHEKDLYNIAETGRRLYGESFDIDNSQSFTLLLPNLLNNQNAKINVFAASTSSSSYFDVSVNGTSQNINFSNFFDYDLADRSSTVFDFNTGNSDNITVNINFSSTSPATQSWLDYFFINAESELRFTSGQMSFRSSETYGAGNVTRYNISNAGSSVTIWDITDKTKPRRVNATVQGNSQSFKLESSNLKEFTAFDKTVFLKPDLNDVKDVENQNLHATSGNTDMIIISYPDFLPQANELKDLHETMDNMSIKVVTQQQVYNEFSSGAPDFSAIRDYVKMVYDKSPEHKLKYLLLFGDGSYDNKSGEGINGNFMITYQQEFSEGLGNSDVTDDFFGYLDDNEGDVGTRPEGLLDIGIGRIPVTSVQEASEHIAKIKRYVNAETFSDWRNQLCFIADDEDANIHMIQTEALTNYVDTAFPVFNIEKIYFDAYTQYTESGGERYPDVNKAITNRIQKGTLLVNYVGHGGENGLAHERIVTISEINDWKNFDKLPLFVTATCEFTRFDDYKFTSAGERVFLNPEGGAIALFTTARIAWISSNGQLTKELYKNMFGSFESGERYCLGDIIRITKVNQDHDNNLIFFLMGDPALHLGFAAENKVITKTINGHPVSEIDTLKALSLASFSGELQDKNGNKLTNFNGIVYPTVYDKIRTVTTQDNNGIGAYTYETRDNTVYKGAASITNGDFDFEFIVPKDIALNVDTGKVSYYAHNGTIDAKGYSFDFLAGDISDDYEEDNTGPEISLYMNDENFVSGGMTDVNPRIYAKLFDEHGINTASGGIGHDITGILDDDIQNIIVMNDDYRADEDTYKSGSLEHFLFNLEQGEHTLKFKAWDVYNNSSEEYIEFLVIEAGNLTIDRLLNYPNPFTTHTDFYFEHNQAGTDIDVLIQIFTVSGKLVKTIESSFLADGYRAGPYPWDGTDDFGNRIGRGVYVYRVKLRSSTGDIAEKYEKLLILK